MTLPPLHSACHQRHSSLQLLTLVLLALLSSCTGNDIVCEEDQQEFQNCIMMLNNDVPDTIEGECTNDNSRAVLKGSPVSVDCDFPLNVEGSIQEWLHYPSTDPQQGTPLPVDRKYEWSGTSDVLMINDVQPEDEGLYVCHIGILGAEDRELVGGCVIITAMTSGLAKGTLVEVSVSSQQDNVVLPTELTFLNAGNCQVHAVILTSEVRYRKTMMDDIVTIVDCSSPPPRCMLSDGVEYDFQELGNVTVAMSSQHGAGLYVLGLSQTCPVDLVQISYSVTFTTPGATSTPSPTVATSTPSPTVATSTPSPTATNIPTVEPSGASPNSNGVSAAAIAILAVLFVM